MSKPPGFIETERRNPPRRAVAERIKDYREFIFGLDEEAARKQGARCMDCSVPFCHSGCPLGNLIPEWNSLVYQGRWRRALDALHRTNNFPEFTGRICPAPCEVSCVLSINQDPVTIESLERAIAGRGWEEGWIVPRPPRRRTDRRVAVVGSGPAGLAAAQQLTRAGHQVSVFERDTSLGGLLRLGIPDFKLEKHIIDRRIEQMEREGTVFLNGVNIGGDYPVEKLVGEFDAVCLAGGAGEARDLNVPGRELRGIHLAMEYLTQQNRVVAGERVSPRERISAEGKRVVILGGGDTGADCLGTAHRQGAEIVYQLELLPEPPRQRQPDNPWPQWPRTLRLSPAHEEGGLRDYGVLTTGFSGSNGRVQRLRAVRVEWRPGGSNGHPVMHKVPGSELEMETDLVLLALGFLHPEHGGMIEQLDVELDARGNVKTEADMMTSVPGVFAAGDMARGQSLVVWAMAGGRKAARGIDRYLLSAIPLQRAPKR